VGDVAAYYVASPALLTRYAGRSEAEIVRTAPALSFRESEVWEMPEGGKVKPSTILTINDLEALAAATLQGIGIARLPGILCNPLIAQGRLQTLLGGHAATGLTVYAVYVSKKQLAPKIRAFIDVLMEHRADFTEPMPKEGRTKK
jgi:DNA-binding transcriptional LysR family regulator